MKNALLEIITGFNSLLTGLRITIGQFFKPTVTVHYPHETLKMPKRFRGHIELVRDAQTGFAKCFVCKLCEKACPSDCITVEGIKPEGFKRRTVTSYRLDFTKCSLCGSCVEVCREGCIRFSREFNLASTSKDDFIMDLFKRLQTEAEAEGKPLPPLPPPATPAAPAAPAAAPAPKAEVANLKSEIKPDAAVPAANNGDGAPAAAPRPSAPDTRPATPDTRPSVSAEVAQ
jgi:NADH-quinone oxidoreductase subunit I